MNSVLSNNCTQLTILHLVRKEVLLYINIHTTAYRTNIYDNQTNGVAGNWTIWA